DYDNFIHYTEIERPRRLVYEHGTHRVGDPSNFHVTVDFTEEGGKTRVTKRAIFSSAEQLRIVVEQYHADRGAVENMDRMSEFVAAASAQPGEFVIARVFDAPRALVWRAYTEAAMLTEWWGPKGMGIRVVSLDVRPGGAFRYAMVAPNGQEMFGKMTYR